MPDGDDAAWDAECVRAEAARAAAREAYAAEFDRLVERAVVKCVREAGCDRETAEEVIQTVIWDMQSDAMAMHYQQGVASAEVDAWYARQVRDLAGG